MNTEPLLSWKNRWLTISVGTVCAVAGIAAVIGFAWIPAAQNNGREMTFWAAICTAAGVVLPYRPANQVSTIASRPSDVVVVTGMLRPADALSIGRGATLAMQCTMCHGVRGMSMAGSPNLAGQLDTVLYKQLRDFKAGHRTSAIMAPLVANLNDQGMRDLAAYYAYLPRERPVRNDESTVAMEPALVRIGAPMRGIGACSSCHGATSANAATPRLAGEPASYMDAQLHAFAAGRRRNDINGQMRNVARHMTDDEIRSAARYYEAQ